MISDIELRHLRYFIAVAEDRSFTRAAARLHIAQPALSQQVRQLEERLGTMLLVRKPRVTLTLAGEAFVASARRAIAHVQQAAETARRVGDGTRAVVHVGLASSAALTTIPLVARQFMAAHPDIEVRLREMHSADQVESLQRGSLDIAMMREPVVDPTLTSFELVREPFVLLTPAKGQRERHKVGALASAAGAPFILFPERTAPTLYGQIMSICREAGFEPRIVHEAQEWHTIAALVGAGLGVSIAPRSVAALRIRGVRIRPLRATESRAVLFLSIPTEGASEAAQRFAAFARKHVGRAGAVAKAEGTHSA